MHGPAGASGNVIILPACNKPAIRGAVERPGERGLLPDQEPLRGVHAAGCQQSATANVIELNQPGPRGGATSQA